MRRGVLSGTLAVSMGLATAAMPQERPLDPEDLLDRMVGRTMAFVAPETGAILGHERFPSRERSVWHGADGLCAQGEVTVEGAALCFRYDAPPHVDYCWLPFEDGLIVGYRSTTTGEEQVIRAADPAEGQCGAEPMS